jgi:hypothetical protein
MDNKQGSNDFTPEEAEKRFKAALRGALKRRLDQPPAGGEVGIALRQGSNRVQVIRHHNDRSHCK